MKNSILHTICSNKNGVMLLSENESEKRNSILLADFELENEIEIVLGEKEIGVGCIISG